MEQQGDRGDAADPPKDKTPGVVKRPTQTKLHHLRDARLRQGLSVRCVAQRLGLTVEEVRAREEGDADVSLTELYHWQAALDVPLEELLNAPQDTLSTQVLTRARLLRVMKTAITLRRQARSEEERRLARLLVEQLVEIMPELEEVTGWPAVGNRRTADDLGRIAENPLPHDWAEDSGGR